MKRNEKKRNLIVITVFALYQLLIFGSSYRYMFDSEGDWKYISIAGLLLSIMGGILLYRILKKNEKKEMLEREFREAEYSNELIKLYSHNTLVYQEQMEQMKTEMKTVLRKIGTELQKQKSDNTGIDFAKIERNTYGERKIYCNNLIIQAVLEEKQVECQKNGFKMKMGVKIGEVKEIAKVHLCSIFSNLLDNAISASLALEESERKIMIKAGIKAEYLVIEVINTSSVSHINQPSVPGHGHGKQILADIAQQYDGYYEAGMEDNLYKAVVILRMGKGK